MTVALIASGTTPIVNGRISLRAVVAEKLERKKKKQPKRGVRGKEATKADPGERKKSSRKGA